MTSVYLIDIVNLGSDTGVKTYIADILSNHTFFLNNDICLSAILLNSSIDGEFGVTHRDGISFYHIPLPYMKPQVILDPLLDNMYSQRVADILEKYIGQPDNAIFHFNWINHSLLANAIKKIFKCKVLLTAHCIPWKSSIITNYSIFIQLQKLLSGEKNDGKVINKYFSAELHGYNLFDMIIAVTKVSKINLERIFNVDNNKIHIIYNGLKPIVTLGYKDLQIEKKELKRKYGFNQQEKILLVVGRDAKSQGIVDFIHIFEKIYLDNNDLNVKLILVGNIDFKEIVKSGARCWNRLIFTGYLPKESLYELYKISDIGIVPSLFEQCSYVALEMMQHGLPIVSTNVDGLSELVSNGFNGFTYNIQYNASSYSVETKRATSVIMELLRNKALRNEISLNARSVLTRKFNAQTMLEHTLRIYNDLIDG